MVWRILAVLWVLGFSGSAMAGQSGGLVCIKWSVNSDPMVCDIYELRVQITAGADTGRPGAFGVGVQLSNGRMAYWTADKGFGEFTIGMVEPADGYYDALPASREYVIFRGTAQDMCQLSGRRDFRVYAAHGVLSAEQEQQVNSLFAGKNTKVSADHVRKVFVQNDVARNPGKGGVVYSHSCSSELSG